MRLSLRCRMHPPGSGVEPSKITDFRFITDPHVSAIARLAFPHHCSSLAITLNKGTLSPGDKQKNKFRITYVTSHITVTI